MEKGWVKLHRQIFENHFLMHDDICFVLFTKLLLTVGRNKGEISGGRKQLAKKYCMSEYVFYRAIKRLESHQIVHSISHSKYTVYTICNWHKYQDNIAQGSAQHPHSTRTAPAHYNKKKNKEKEVGPSKIDEDLIAKEQVAVNRKSGYESFSNIGNLLKQRKI